jgi:Nucleotidyltransferase
VRFDANVTATRDIDLLWDVRKRMSFWTQMERLDSSFLALLKKVDSSFRIRQSQRYTAVNAEGFEVDILRRLREGDDPHPIKISERTKGEQAVDHASALEELSVVQAARADVFLNTPSFEAVIVDRNGRMAMMRTIQPRVFVGFKHWMSGLPDREPIKRQRDAAQAKAVQALLDEERLI